MREEVWKDIKGYEGYYQISSYGRVKSLERDIFKKNGEFKRRKKENIKIPKTSTDGYYDITLSVNGNDKTYHIHRLVAEAFIEKPDRDEKLEVNHKDCNRKNNYFENLEWVTHDENVKYAASLGNMHRAYGADNPNYGNDTLKKKYEQHPELKMKCSRPRELNGRAIALTMKNIITNEEMSFNFIGECCEYLIANNESKSKIDSLRNTVRRYMDSGKVYKNKYIFTYA